MNIIRRAQEHRAVRGFRRELEAANMMPRRLSPVESYVRDRAAVDEALADCSPTSSHVEQLRRHYADGFADGVESTVSMILGRDDGRGGGIPYAGTVPARLRAYLEAVERELGRTS